jgi:thiol-disulfide isomerase/thioredoxin
MMVVAGVLEPPDARGQPAPTNDNFASAAPLTGTNTVVTGSNINATKEAGEPNHAGNPGGKSVWWYWQSPIDGYVTISTAGSTSIYGGPLDTLLGVYTGSSVSGLSTIASNDDGPTDSTSLVTFHAYAGETYRVAVDGFTYDVPQDAASGTVNLSLTLSPSLPLAPPWDLPSINGTNIDSTNFAGRVVLLNFWATWCIPCQGEIPALVALEQKYGSNGLTVVGMSVDDSVDGVNPPTSVVAPYAANAGVNYPVVMTRPSHLGVEAAFGGIPYTPQTFVLDRQNHITQTFAEAQEFTSFENAIYPLLYANLRASLSVSNRQARISWPLIQAATIVQSNSNLSTTNWATVGVPIQSDGTNSFITVPVTTTPRFFRIRSQ